jgi:hypothetical protein
VRQVNGVGAPQTGPADCAALCPSAKDILCQVQNKCWKSLVSISAGLIALLAGGVLLRTASSCQSPPNVCKVSAISVMSMWLV